MWFSFIVTSYFLLFITIRPPYKKEKGAFLFLFFQEEK